MAIGKRNAPKKEPEVVTDTNLVPKDGIKEVSNIVTEPEKTAIVDTYRVPSSHLLQYGEGSPWPVKAYYSQILGVNDTLELFDQGNTNPTQQYKKIEKLVISVTSPIKPQQDSDTKAFELSGSGNIVNSVVPNKHDVFIAEIGDGDYGVFSLKTTERKSHNKIAVYETEYQMLYRLTPELEALLDSKVTETFVFEPRRAALKEEVVMTKDSHRRFVSVLEAIREIQMTYPLEFYDKASQSLTVPVNDGKIYDGFLTDFARNIGCGDDRYSYTIYPHPPYKTDDIRTVWWMLENNFARAKVSEKFKKYHAGSFAGLMRPGSIGWSVYDWTHFPADIDPVNISKVSPGRMVMQPMGLDESEGFEPEPSKTTYSEVEDGIPYILPIDSDYYVFSEKFYQGGAASLLEHLMRCYLEHKQVNPEDILAVTERVWDAPALERFYYLPVCVLLLKYSR
tara:strand:+ start:5607 stop:6959 length:1353 start_codon:yes stop_codon:yes gene_type:complete